MSPVNKKIAEAVIGNSNRVISIKNKIIQIDASLNKLTESLMISDSSQAIIDKITELENKKDSLNEELNNLENDKPVAITPDDVDSVKKKFIRDFVQEIVVLFPKKPTAFRGPRESFSKKLGYQSNCSTSDFHVRIGRDFCLFKLFVHLGTIKNAEWKTHAAVAWVFIKTL